MTLSRRTFLSGLAAQAALQSATDSKTGMQTRILGKTGQRISVLIFGCGSRFLMYPDKEQSFAAIQRALDAGITYFDSAYGYGNGKSEELVGEALAGRKDLFVVSKINFRKAEEAKPVIEASLKRLRRDRFDLLHIHALGGPEDLAAIEAPDGILKHMYQLRDQKVARHIGITCHTYPDVLATALQRHDFDCTQMALNAARSGNPGRGKNFKNPEPKDTSFEGVALPVALKKKMGVTAMKIFGQEALNGKASVEELIRYSMTLPVAGCVIGMPKLEQIDENARVAKSFRPMNEADMESLAGRLSTTMKAKLDAYFEHHVDC